VSDLGSSDVLSDEGTGETPPASQLVGVAMDGAVAVLTMQAAPYNLLNREMIEAIINALGWAQGRHARAVILRSSLRHFSAGADLNQMMATVDANDGALDWKMVELLEAFDDFPAPVVASVHGVCVGGGLELVLACDISVVTESAKLGSVEVTVGLNPLMGAVQRVVQRAGMARGKEMAMLGRRYDAATLERWGVINQVVPDEQLDAATMTIAQELAHGPTVCHAATKKLAAIAVDQGVRAADVAMPGMQREIFRSVDFHTGVRSYREKGPGQARFEGC
jgi:enoyl-CoA hydratase/carnithine racemase